ncbi:MAG TPA: subclass B3 metallo-beta-lactamase [Longimicrobiales bacterium]|nr:subclass B3 metallo-beta-lactamase [Longimicrobiales bacterium]
MGHPSIPGALSSALAVLLLAGCGTGSSDAPSVDGARTEDFSPAAFAAACDAWDEWEKPAPPFRIHGGTYHVGTCGISVILVTSPEGHLLIDSGTEGGAELVAANIEKLGFSLGDVRYLTHTQEHHDHIGGIAYLKSRTGARMVANARARSVFETGVINTDDPQYEPHEPMATLTVDELVADGEAIVVGGKEIVANHTPGHSPGAISWRWEECEEDRCVSLVFTDGMGPFAADGYRWTDHPGYLADYRASLTWLETVEADICLAAHPSQMRLIERIEAGNLVDRGECNRSGAFTKERVEMIVADERMSLRETRDTGIVGTAATGLVAEVSLGEHR